MSFFNITVDEGVGIMRFNRPPVNAVSYQVYIDLDSALDELEKNDDVSVVLFTGSAGIKPFCGGGDLNEFMELDRESRLRRYEIVDKVMPRLGSFPKPIIAAINGPVVGVGVAMVAICDFRYVSSNAFFMIPEIDRGVVSSHLAKFKKINVAEGIIKEWILTGRRFTAAEAYRWGLVNQVINPEYLFDDSLRTAKKIARKPKQALMYYKKAFLESENMPWQESYVKSHAYSADLTAHSNAKEGIRAFFEKRDPVYKD